MNMNRPWQAVAKHILKVVAWMRKLVSFLPMHGNRLDFVVVYTYDTILLIQDVDFGPRFTLYNSTSAFMYACMTSQIQNFWDMRHVMYSFAFM